MDHHLRVVLVEDEIPVRAYIQHLLESLGCIVDCVDIVDMTRLSRAAVTADLVLLDTTLPGVDVGSVLLKLRQCCI